MSHLSCPYKPNHILALSGPIIVLLSIAGCGRLSEADAIAAITSKMNSRERVIILKSIPRSKTCIEALVQRGDIEIVTKSDRFLGTYTDAVPKSPVFKQYWRSRTDGFYLDIPTSISRVKITGMQESGEHRTVEFTGLLGFAIDIALPAVCETGAAATREGRGMAIFTKYTDGWRITSMD